MSSRTATVAGGSGTNIAPRENAGPWNAEELWWPRHEGQPAYLLPPICNIEDGPSGIAYYPGTGLTPEYAGNLFITHFKGSITHSGIYRYKVKPAGASYAIDTAAPFLRGALPTDVRFGPDGKLYYSDWAEGWPKSRRGRIYTIFDPKRINDPLIKETQRLIGGDWSKRSPSALATLLAHPDWRVRLAAQYTLAGRGTASVPTFSAVAVAASDAPGAALARRHAVWGLGQIARHDPGAINALRPLLQHPDAEVRAQSTKTLGDLRDTASAGGFVTALTDDSARVRFFAAQALGRINHTAATPALLAAVRENDDTDAYLRHALVVGLVGCATPAELTATTSDQSRAVRRAAVLALRRRRDATVAAFLHDADPLIVREAVLAINDAPIPAAYPAVAAFLQSPVDDEAVMLRALNAAFRLGGLDDAAAIAMFAARTDASESLRTEALELLGLWPQPPRRDRIVGIFRPLPEETRHASLAADALSRHFHDLMAVANPDTVKQAAIDAAVALRMNAGMPELGTVVKDQTQSGEIRATALSALGQLDSPDLPALVALALESNAPQLRLAALADREPPASGIRRHNAGHVA